jgi:hypothetical protein
VTSIDTPDIAGRVITDRHTIVDLIYRYCRAMDRCDAELGYSVWHEDGEADYGVLFKGTGRGFVDFALQAHHDFMLMHSHQVTNIILTLDGDRASSESYTTAALRHKEGERLMQTTVRGRYLDRWSCRNGRWGIDRRIYAHDFDEDHEITATVTPGWGRRDRSDASYQVLFGV